MLGKYKATAVATPIASAKMGHPTTPITTCGRIIFAVGCGVITFIIRYFCAYPEGVSFSILIMNILTPFIEKWTEKQPLGGVK